MKKIQSNKGNLDYGKPVGVTKWLMLYKIQRWKLNGLKYGKQ